MVDALFEGQRGVAPKNPAKGEVVHVTANTLARHAREPWIERRFRPEDDLVVTSCSPTTINVKRTGFAYDGTFKIERSSTREYAGVPYDEAGVRAAKAARAAAKAAKPKPRKLGTPPEGEGIIGPDHPGIQWLWDDMGKYADKQGWCPTYDTLTAELGIPGRKRDFTARHKIGGIEVTSRVKARSQAEADALLAETLAKAVVAKDG